MEKLIQLRWVLLIAAIVLVVGFVVGFFVKPSGISQTAYEEIQGQLVQAQGQATQFGADLDALRAQHQTLEQERDSLTNTVQNRETEVGSLTQQVTALNADVAQLKGTVAQLNTQLQAYALDNAMMMQLKTFYSANSPFEPGPPATLFHALEDGSLLFLQFDAPVTQATKLRYWGMAVPGRFCKDKTFESLAAQGYIHFRAAQAPNESSASGGRPGEQGYWMKFIALGQFEMPWGNVAPGVDLNYEPTEPPACSQG